MGHPSSLCVPSIGLWTLGLYYRSPDKVFSRTQPSLCLVQTVPLHQSLILNFNLLSWLLLGRGHTTACLWRSEGSCVESVSLSTFHGFGDFFSSTFTWVQELTQVIRLTRWAPLLLAPFGKQKSGLAYANYKIWKYFLGHGFIQATLTLIIYSLLLFLT